MAPALEVPAAWFASAPELPGHCVRHGLPATRREDFVVKSRPKLSPWRRTLLPGHSSLDRAGEYARSVKLTRVSGWPLCGRCGRVRTAGLVLANVLFFGGVAMLIASLVLRAQADGPVPMLLVPILGAFAARGPRRSSEGRECSHIV